jgi:hypothetical protein
MAQEIGVRVIIVKAETADGMSSTTWLVANKSCFNLSETWHREDRPHGQYWVHAAHNLLY